MPLRQGLLPQKKSRERPEALSAEALSPESLSPALEQYSPLPRQSPLPQNELLSPAPQPLERPRLLRQHPPPLSPSPQKEVLSPAAQHLERPRSLLWPEPLWREAILPE